MNILINSNLNTQIPELTSGNEFQGNSICASQAPSIPTRPDLSSYLAVYYSDYYEHIWALSWIMRYLDW